MIDPRNALCGAACLSLALSLLFSQGLRAESLPDRRPAMVGGGPGSLVNLIDAQTLFQKGQRDAWVMFEGTIAPDGVVYPSEFSTFSPDSQLLRDEVRRRFRVSRFVPAVYNGRRTWAYFAGTAVYFVANGRPHVRVYAHQELDEMKRGSDFVAPQLVFVPGHEFIPGMPDYPSATAQGKAGGVTKLRHSLDANGKTTDVQVISENPPGLHFGETAAKAARLLDFLPGYRNGHPVACTYTLTWAFGHINR
ncbi:MAG: energy transducer TonB [Chthoniobacterales bacterium]